MVLVLFFNICSIVKSKVAFLLTLSLSLSLFSVLFFFISRINYV